MSRLGVVSKPFAFTNELVAFDEVQRVIDIDFTVGMFSKCLSQDPNAVRPQCVSHVSL